MPTYDFGCSACGNRFEGRRAMAAPNPACPVCGAATEQLYLSAPAVHGRMARGREQAVRTLEPKMTAGHGPSCPCCH
jgi:putative FmdB family regulatory protein